jgi:hypothetical protein
MAQLPKRHGVCGCVYFGNFGPQYGKAIAPFGSIAMVIVSLVSKWCGTEESGDVTILEIRVVEL